MNEMELLRELAQQTPLPAPAELGAARARLVAAITTDPATYATAVAEVTTDQPDVPAGQPPGLLRPPAPAPVRTAARFMHGGAISTAALLIVALPFAGDVKGHVLGHRLTPTPLTITLVTLAGLALIALWLWMARATSQGRNWARILCTVLFGLATLELIRVRPQYPGGYLAHFAVGGHVYSVIHSVFGATVLGLIVPVLLWLAGLAAVWLLWRPASGAFFKPDGAPAA
jgi:hypothetical protein